MQALTTHHIAAQFDDRRAFLLLIVSFLLPGYFLLASVSGSSEGGCPSGPKSDTSVPNAIDSEDIALS